MSTVLHLLGLGLSLQFSAHRDHSAFCPGCRSSSIKGLRVDTTLQSGLVRQVDEPRDHRIRPDPRVHMPCSAHLSGEPFKPSAGRHEALQHVHASGRHLEHRTHKDLLDQHVCGLRESVDKGLRDILRLERVELSSPVL